MLSVGNSVLQLQFRKFRKISVDYFYLGTLNFSYLDAYSDFREFSGFYLFYNPWNVLTRIRKRELIVCWSHTVVAKTRWTRKTRFKAYGQTVIKHNIERNTQNTAYSRVAYLGLNFGGVWDMYLFKTHRLKDSSMRITLTTFSYILMHSAHKKCIA